MTNIDWLIRGPEISTCNCDWGCPCQFNSVPTYGNCRAAVAMRIDEGHFGDIDLTGGARASGVMRGDLASCVVTGGGAAVVLASGRVDLAEVESLSREIATSLG